MYSCWTQVFGPVIPAVAVYVIKADIGIVPIMHVEHDAVNPIKRVFYIDVQVAFPVYRPDDSSSQSVWSARYASDKHTSFSI